MVEWDVPFTIISSFGSVPLNSQDGETGGYYMVVTNKCQGGPAPLRAVFDTVPQADGSILHSGFKPGYVMKLTVQFWEAIGGEGQPACDSLLQAMWDRIILHLNDLVNPTVGALEGGNSRVLWTPSGSAGRMLDRVQLLDWPTVEYDGPVTEISFVVHTPYPYAISQSQSEIGLGATIVNAGTAEFWPVVRIQGPFSDFTLVNETLDLQIIYDGSLPGATDIGAIDFLELNMFHNTAYQNGDGANAKAGIDILSSDFFPIAPGANDISISGASAVLLMNDAWV